MDQSYQNRNDAHDDAAPTTSPLVGADFNSNISIAAIGTPANIVRSVSAGVARSTVLMPAPISIHQRTVSNSSAYNSSSTGTTASLSSALIANVDTLAPHLGKISMNENEQQDLNSQSNSIIHDAARITDWRKVQSLATNHPHHASYKCDHGLTSLHHACTRRCPHPAVFQALISAYPHALVEKDDGKGWTPLHHACRFKCPTECVRLLLHSYPKYGRYACQVRDKDKGRTPLYYAMRYDAPDGVVELLLKCMQRDDILDCDRDGMSVLGLVWDKWVTSYEGKRIMVFYSKIVKQWKAKKLDIANDDHTNKAEEAWWNKVLVDSKKLKEGLKEGKLKKLKKNWEKANMLLRGAFGFNLNVDEDVSGRKFRILHAASAIRCHESLFTMACALHPEQAREIDLGDLFSSRSSTENNEIMESMTALHLAAKSRSSGPDSRKVMQGLLVFYPETASMQNPADSSLPLHYLCGNESKMHWVQDGIRSIYDAFPNAATCRDSHGRTPLHRAAALEEDSFIITSPPLISSDNGTGASARLPTPSAISSRSQASIDPVGHASSSRNSISSVEDRVGSIVQNILLTHPEVASFPDILGKTPLHSIAEYAEDWDANVEAIFNAFPEALSKRDGSKSLPMHLVSSNLDAKPRLIQKIVECNPRASTLVNGQGMLPLHLACGVGKSWVSGLKDIFEAFPRGITMVDDERGWTPLHFLVSSSHSTLETIEKILELGMDAACVLDKRGRTPFHLAVESGKAWDDGLELLFQSNPDAIDAPDALGKIPIVTALLHYCEDGIISLGSKNTIDSSQLDPENYENGEPRDGNTSNDIGSNCCDMLDMQNVSQINVLFNLLRTAPQVLNSRDAPSY